jgi:hypothetical protein
MVRRIDVTAPPGGVRVMLVGVVRRNIVSLEGVDISHFSAFPCLFLSAA